MHTNNTAKRKWSTRKKWLLLGGVPLSLVALPAAALAAYFALAGISGSGTNGDFTAKWAAMAPSLDTSALTVKPAGDATVNSGRLDLPALTIYPTESFTIEAAVVAGGANQAGYVAGVSMPGLPAGTTAEVVSGCGAKVTTSMTYVKVKVTAPASLVAGASWSLGADSGVKVTPLASSSATAPTGVTCAPYVAP